MNKPNFPAEYNQLMSYLMMPDANGFMNFMEQIFGAQVKMKHMSNRQTVQHGELLIGDCVIMLSEAGEPHGTSTGAFFIYLTDADAVYTNAIAAGATSVMPMSDLPYGRSGGIKDAWGNTWWATTHK